MKIFYRVWFFVCSIYGYMFTQLSIGIQNPPTVSILDLAYSFLGSIVIFGVMVFLFLHSRSMPVEFARIRTELKPWECVPLGAIQFVFISFIFISLWSFGLSFFYPSAQVILSLKMFTACAGGLTGFQVACYLYRAKFST